MASAATREPQQCGYVFEAAYRSDATRSESRVFAVPRSVMVAATVAAIFGLNMAAIAFRQQIAKSVPGLALVFDDIGLSAGPVLKVQDVDTNLGGDGVDRGLSVAVHIVNAGSVEAALPDLRIVVRDDAAQSIYTWVEPAPLTRIAPGQVVPFHSRLVTPPTEGRDVVVGFVPAADRVSANRVSTGP